jgi:hypothetical protein
MSPLEFVDHKYAFAHFEKTNIENFPGIGSFHNQRVANLLAERGIQCINIEQDLAIAGLQMSKRIRSVQFFEEIRGPLPRGRLELTPDLLIVG